MSFVSYLTLNDYLTTIQSGQLNNQLLDSLSQGGGYERKSAELWSVSIIKGILSDFYNIDSEITDTLPYSPTKKYWQGSRCTIDFDDWIPGSGQVNDDDGEGAVIQYVNGDCRINNGFGWICTNPNADTTFIESNWQNIGRQYDIYFLPKLYTEFYIDIQTQKSSIVNGFYRVGDTIFYKGKLYKCLVETIVLSHNSKIQYFSTSDFPHSNQFPDQHGQVQWSFISDYFYQNEPPFYPNLGNTSNVETSVSDSVEGQNDTDTSVVVSITDSIWELGDNRDPILLQDMINLSLWMLHKRISPNLIPKLREDAKAEAFERLRMIQRGEFYIQTPILQPLQIGTISGGSEPKSLNRKR